MMEKLRKDGFIKVKVSEEPVCGNCKYQPPSDTICTECPECGNDMVSKNSSYKIKPEIKHISKFISDLVKKEGIIVGKRPLKRKFGRKNYEFIKISYKGKNAYIHILSEYLSKKLLEYFIRSSLPLLVIRINSSVPRERLEGNLIESINFCEVLSKHENRALKPNKFSTSFDEIIKNSAEKVQRNARISASNVKRFLENKSDYGETELENDVFNIIKIIAVSAEKWGKEYTRKSIPDGIGGLSYKKGVKTFRTSFTWDCKFSEKTTGYDIDNRKEERKARAYIKNITMSKEIQDFSKKLNSFIIFSNNIDLTKFTGFSEFLLKTRITRRKRWSGIVVLFDLSAVLELYESFRNNWEDVFLRWNRFSGMLSNMLCKKDRNSPFNHITQDRIISLFNSLKDYPKETKRIDADSLRIYVNKEEW
jgi:hypothetical protein